MFSTGALRSELSARAQVIGLYPPGTLGELEHERAESSAPPFDTQAPPELGDHATLFDYTPIPVRIDKDIEHVLKAGENCPILNFLAGEVIFTGQF